MRARLSDVFWRLGGLLYRLAYWLDCTEVDHDLTLHPTIIRAEHRDAFVLRGWSHRTRTSTRIYVPVECVDELARSAIMANHIVWKARPQRREAAS